MDNPKYYENYNWDEAALGNKLQKKIQILKELIPHSVSSILDIGCGDGSISNELNKDYKVYSLDRSFNALKHVRTIKIQASAGELPVKPGSVDLLFSSEMLEHLPDDIFNDAIKELNETSRDYILLTFPNNENIEKNFVKCPKCNFVFNKSYHLRKLNKELIKNLFPSFELISYSTHGKKIRRYNEFVGRMKHKFTPAESWIPALWTPDNRRDTMCPNCNHSFVIPYKFNIIAFACDLLNILISSKEPYQLFVLLKRKVVK